MYYGYPPDYEAPPPYGLSERPEPVKFVQDVHSDPQFMERIRHMVKENKGDTDRRLDKLKQDMTLSHAHLQHQLEQLQTIEKAHLDQKTQETIRNIMLVFEDRFNILERDLVDTIHSAMSWLDTIPVLESRHAEMSERIKELTLHVSVIQSQFREMDQFVRKNELIERIQSLTDSSNTKEQDIKRMLIQHITEHENHIEQITASNEHVKRQLLKNIEELSQKEIKHQEQLDDIEGKLSELNSSELREKKLQDEIMIKRIEALEERDEQFKQSLSVYLKKFVTKQQIKLEQFEEKLADRKADIHFDDSKLTPEEIEDIQKILSVYIAEFKKYNNHQPIIRKPPTQLINNLFEFLTKNKENVFLSSNMSLSGEDKDKPLIHWPVFIFTNKNIYFIRENSHIISRIENDTQYYKQDTKSMAPALIKSYTELREKSEIYVKQHINDTHEICLLYTFKEPLNFAMMKYIRDNFLKKYPAQNVGVIFDFDKKVVRENGGYYNFLSLIPNADANISNMVSFPQQYEEIIRVLPGSYQNGDWVALGGFFGLYFNMKTFEISVKSPKIPI